MAIAGFFGWSPLSTAIIVTIVIFFILAIANKWLGQMIPFNQWLAYVALPVCLGIAWKWSPKVGAVIGILGGLTLGIVGGYMFGETEAD